MAQQAAFINKTRARATDFLKLVDDVRSLSAEYTAVGGTAFIDANQQPGGTPFDFSQTDITRAQFLALLAALNAVLTTVNTGNNARDLYIGKV